MCHYVVNWCDKVRFSHLLVINHRLRGSASPVLTATLHSYGSLAWLSDFFFNNYWRISYRFRYIDAFSSKIACFFHLTLVWRPLAEERRACNINVIYTPQKTTFNGLQFRCWHYGSVFICLAVVASQNREISWNFAKKFLDETYLIKTRGIWLPYGENFIILTSTGLLWYTRVTDGRVDGRMDGR